MSNPPTPQQARDLQRCLLAIEQFYITDTLQELKLLRSRNVELIKHYTQRLAQVERELARLAV